MIDIFMTFLWLPPKYIVRSRMGKPGVIYFVPSEPSKMLEQMMGTQ